ncbi:MAG: hypothetical protein QME81_18550, partial [bacterium]|nr:hypothetical protein [bacterium]
RNLQSKIGLVAARGRAKGEKLQYYVPRQIEIINQLNRQIEASEGDPKILFSGIPGCGKSTE